jgi:hypothetical protein
MRQLDNARDFGQKNQTGHAVGVAKTRKGGEIKSRRK